MALLSKPRGKTFKLLPGELGTIILPLYLPSEISLKTTESESVPSVKQTSILSVRPDCVKSLPNISQ